MMIMANGVINGLRLQLEARRRIEAVRKALEENAGFKVSRAQAMRVLLDKGYEVLRKQLRIEVEL